MARRRTPPIIRDPFDPFDGPVDHTIDLHGLRADEARSYVLNVIASVHRKAPGGLIHIITGKGRGSTAGPVLKRTIRTLLKSGQVPNIETWAADLDDGGYVVRMKGTKT